MSATRRGFLKRVALATSGLLWEAGFRKQASFGAPSVIDSPRSKPKLRPDLLDADSTKGIEIVQLTTEADVPSSHLYMASRRTSRSA